jgi:hypothetical protein
MGSKPGALTTLTVRFPRTAPCAFFCASAARVRSAINARSFCAKAAYRCSMNGSASAPSSVTMNGTRLSIRPEINATSRDRRQSFATTTGSCEARWLYIDVGTIGAHMLNGAFYSLQYDVLNAFAPISPLVATPLVLFARKTLSAKDLNELIAWLKANPNKASAGIGAVSFRLVAAFFQKETGTQVTLVPYRGVAPAVQDLAAGQIDLWFGPPDQLPLMRAGSIKAYAATGDMRIAVAPDIPTFAEMGLPVLSYTSWGGLFAPRGTPRDIIGKLNAAAVEAAPVELFCENVSR